MNPVVDWWRGTDRPPPASPLLVLALGDDPDAVSCLPTDHGATFERRESATARVAHHLGVPIFVAGSGPLPTGHDLLLLGSVGRGMTTLAAQVAVAQFGAEPQLVVGFGSGITDVQWMRKVEDVRSRTDPDLPRPVRQLADVLETTDAPVLLDGVVAAAAAAAVPQRPHLCAPVLGDEPCQQYLLDRCEAPVWGVPGLGPGEGLGALSGLAMLRLALLAAG